MIPTISSTARETHSLGIKRTTSTISFMICCSFISCRRRFQVLTTPNAVPTKKSELPRTIHRSSLPGVDSFAYRWESTAHAVEAQASHCDGVFVRRVQHDHVLFVSTSCVQSRIGCFGPTSLLYSSDSAKFSASLSSAWEGNVVQIQKPQAKTCRY